MDWHVVKARGYELGDLIRGADVDPPYQSSHETIKVTESQTIDQLPNRHHIIITSSRSLTDQLLVLQGRLDGPVRHSDLLDGLIEFSLGSGASRVKRWVGQVAGLGMSWRAGEGAYSTMMISVCR